MSFPEDIRNQVWEKDRLMPKLLIQGCSVATLPGTRQQTCRYQRGMEDSRPFLPHSATETLRAEPWQTIVIRGSLPAGVVTSLIHERKDDLIIWGPRTTRGIVHPSHILVDCYICFWRSGLNLDEELA
ncbi:hypothetical protein OS493_024993 [Desmophyllum pertusum]|uniref:Uncharacterized protein n=1 Tax=Desmophyllum pertusum TaxID=174260 RepID=A0A9W9YPL0_9CNID|nr:hypothetical protein OS493_024993 [Desmophyllum pertusum]